MGNQAPTSTALNAVGLFFSTSTGNTETDAGYVGEAAGGLEAVNIADAEADAITGADGLIIGAPPGTLVPMIVDQELIGMTGSTILFRIWNWKANPSRSLDVVINPDTRTTIVMRPVNYMISSPPRVAR